MTNATNTPTPALLRELLSYNPDTGLLHWLKPVAQRIKVGAEAGCKGPGGYRVVRVLGANYLAHRVAWAIHYGEWPAENIDHFDGNPSDNTIGNLRLATPAENNANRRKVRSDSTHVLVYPGVYWYGEGCTLPIACKGPSWPWMVRHHRDGKTVYRTQPDLLSAVALKMRLQAGGEIPPRGVKGGPGR